MFMSLPSTKSRSAHSTGAKSEAARRISHGAIGILGAKGGVGATTVSINLAAALGMEQTCFLLDANLQQPAAAVLLGRTPKFGLSELMSRDGIAEPEIAEACGVPISNTKGNALLISPSLDGQAALNRTLTEVADVLKGYRGVTGTWIIDLPKYLDHHLVTLMDQCDKLVLVFEPTIAATTLAVDWLRKLEELGYSDDKVVCALNRSGSKPKLVESQLGQMKAFPNLVRIPNAFELAEGSSRDCEPIICVQPKGPFAESIAELARIVGGPKQ